MSASIVRSERIEFEVFATVCDLHPDLLDVLVELGVVEPRTDPDGRRWFDRTQIDEMSRVRRLRVGLGLSYSAIAVVTQLIDRVDELEDEVRRLRAHAARQR